VLLMARAGLRRGEVLGLRRSDVHLLADSSALEVRDLARASARRPPRRQPEPGGELAGLQMAAGVTLRGLAAVQAEWSSRHTPARGKAGMFDCPADLPGRPSLDGACQQAHLTGRSGCQAAILDEAVTAAMTVERALTMALICARHLGRYTWDGTLDMEEIMTASTWDCLS
jgi:hypothetical protein